MTVLEHTFRPRGSARELFSIRDKEVLVSGPAGTGKSRACLEKLNAIALANPGMRGLIVRKTATSLTNTALVTFKQWVIAEQLAHGSVKWYGGSGSTPASFQYSNGSTIEVGGMDKPSKIMSSEYDIIYVQEATELRLEDWEALLTRLRNGVVSFQQLLADCNPASDTHWLKQRADQGIVKLLNSKHEENPRYFDDEGNLTAEGKAYIEEGLDRLTGVYHKRFRLGLWVGAEGQVYDGFDPAIHVLPSRRASRSMEDCPAGLPASWSRYWTVDFGYTNPMVVQFWAEDHDGRLYLYRELYQTQQLVEDMCRQILDIVRPDGVWLEPTPQAIICDHDAEDRATFDRHIGFMGTVPARKNVSEGIQAVATRFRRAGDGKPRLYIFEDALYRVDEKLRAAKKPFSTLQELPGYVWAPDKESPLKAYDHGMDAMRYMVAYKDHASMVRFRRL